MSAHGEIQINRFQLGVLLTGLDKNLFNCIIDNNIYCSHCKSFAIRGIIVDSLFLTKLNDVKVYGRCKICNTEVVRLLEFGNVKIFRDKAIKLRESLNEMTLLNV